MKKIAVFFPGIGYNPDKPLLYYARKLASEAGYDKELVIDYCYKAGKIRGDNAKMKEAYEKLYQAAAQDLKDVDFGAYDDVLFVSKSIGTAIATSYAQNMGIENVRHILYTPLEQTFSILGQKKNLSAIAFIGTADPWSDVPKVVDLAGEYSVPVYTYEGTNHSLEKDDTIANLETLRDVMKKSKDWILT